MINRISLITGSERKARVYTALFGVEIVPVQTKLTEIQSLDVTEVARRKVEDAYLKLRSPVLVDDTGLSLLAWNGLPGALVAWFLEAVGAQGILDMTTGLADRQATSITALGYADANGVRVFTGSMDGMLATEQRGHNSFGYDTIFIPSGWDITFAEMSDEQRNAISQRRRAVDELQKEIGLVDEWLGPAGGP